MTDSSSEDDNLIRLQQSVDEQFFNNDLFMEETNSKISKYRIGLVGSFFLTIWNLVIRNAYWKA